MKDIIEAMRAGIEIKIFNSYGIGMASKVRNMDAVIVSQIKCRIAIPLLMRHSCGQCTLRDCFSCLKNSGGSNDA